MVNKENLATATTIKRFYIKGKIQEQNTIYKCTIERKGKIKCSVCKKDIPTKVPYVTKDKVYKTHEYSRWERCRKKYCINCSKKEIIKTIQKTETQLKELQDAITVMKRIERSIKYREINQKYREWIKWSKILGEK